jgi:hypothetical protein
VTDPVSVTLVLFIDPKINEPAAYARYEAEKEMHDRISIFFRHCGRYPLTGVSRINLYSVFCETGNQLLSSAGRLGMVIASGIATDDNNKGLFDALIKTNQIIHVCDFENREGIFHGVHRSYKFALLCVAGNGGKRASADFAFYLGNTDELSRPERHFSLNAVDLDIVNPISHTCPTFRSSSDAELSKHIYRRVPTWISHKDTKRWPGNPKTPFNMSNDSGLFIDRAGQTYEKSVLEDNLPVYESKFIHQFNHRYAAFGAGSNDAVKDFSESELQDPNATVTTRYWMDRGTLAQRFPGRWFFVYRMITRATDERTAIACIIPERPCVPKSSFSQRTLIKPPQTLHSKLVHASF